MIFGLYKILSSQKLFFFFLTNIDIGKYWLSAMTAILISVSANRCIPTFHVITTSSQVLCEGSKCLSSVFCNYYYDNYNDIDPYANKQIKT